MNGLLMRGLKMQLMNGRIKMEPQPNKCPVCQQHFLSTESPCECYKDYMFYLYDYIDEFDKEKKANEST